MRPSCGLRTRIPLCDTDYRLPIRALALRYQQLDSTESWIDFLC